MLIKAKAMHNATHPNREYGAEHDMGNNLDGAIGAFGSEYVHHIFIAGQKVKFQSIIRGLMDKKRDEGEKWQDQIDAELAAHDWKVPTAQLSSTERVKALMAKMSDAERTTFIAYCNSGED